MINPAINFPDNRLRCQEAFKEVKVYRLIVLSGSLVGSTLNSWISVSSIERNDGMDLLGSFLYLVPIALLVACIAWLVKFINSQQKGERSILRWREMSSPRKALTGGISVWIFLSLYLALGDELALLNVTVLPFSWIYSLAVPADLWGTTTTVVVLAVLFQLRYPRRLITA